MVEAYEAGEGAYAALAARFRLGEATVKRWVWQFWKEGHLTPQKKGGGRQPFHRFLQELESIVERLGDATAAQMTAEYNRGRRGKQRRHRSSIVRALQRVGYVVKVVKKRGSARSNSSGRTLLPSDKPSSAR